MPEAFSITIFSKHGDPQGIRHLDKSNWSGGGVVFPRDQFDRLNGEPGFNQAGVYLLIGNAADETLYIGEADPLGDRLKAHVANKEGWDWGVYFFDTHHRIGKTEAQFLEAQLVARAIEYDRAILLNKNRPANPTMSPKAEATARAFLADILQIVPMLGITAFTPPTPADEVTTAESATVEVPPQDDFDTVVVPAREEGFQQRFLGENLWFAIRIHAANLSRIKYIAAYRVSPIAAITHLAPVASIEPYGNSGKYLLRFTEPATEVGPIPRLPGNTVNMQSPRYAKRDRLLAASNLDEVWE